MVMVSLTGTSLPAAASETLPLNVHFFASAAHLPRTVISPVDMLSIQVPNRSLVTLSNPSIPIPSKGWSIMLPLTSCWMYRPPRMGLNSASASLFCGGAPGAIQELTWSFHLPASLASLWCSGPGVAALMYFSIIACSSAVGLCPEALGSWALAATDAAARSSAAAEILDDVIGRPPLLGRGG